MSYRLASCRASHRAKKFYPRHGMTRHYDIYNHARQCDIWRPRLILFLCYCFSGCARNAIRDFTTAEFAGEKILLISLLLFQATSRERTLRSDGLKPRAGSMRHPLRANVVGLHTYSIWLYQQRGQTAWGNKAIRQLMLLFYGHYAPNYIATMHVDAALSVYSWSIDLYLSQLRLSLRSDKLPTCIHYVHKIT